MKTSTTVPRPNVTKKQSRLFRFLMALIEYESFQIFLGTLLCGVVGGTTIKAICYYFNESVRFTEVALLALPVGVAPSVFLICFWAFTCKIYKDIKAAWDKSELDNLSTEIKQ